MKKLLVACLAMARHPLGLFLILVMTLGRVLSGGALLALAFPLAWFFRALGERPEAGGAVSERLLRAGRKTVLHFLDRGIPTQLFLLVLVFDELLALRGAGSLAILLTLLLHAFRRSSRTEASFFPEGSSNPWIARIEGHLARGLHGLAGSFLLLVVSLHLLFNQILGEAVHGINLAMLAWVIRRNRHFLVERGWKTKEAITELFELDESYRWLRRLSTLYLLLGLLALAGIVFALRQGSPLAQNPRSWQALAFLVVSLPAAGLIRHSPRIAATFLAGWVVCGMYLALLAVVLEPSQGRNLSFLLGEFAIPMAMLWYLRSEIGGVNAHARRRTAHGLSLPEGEVEA